MILYLYGKSILDAKGKHVQNSTSTWKDSIPFILICLPASNDLRISWDCDW